jgi:hypothetical protein
VLIAILWIIFIWHHFSIKVREESAYKLDAEMLKAKICGRRSVEDKKDQNKIWTHKYSNKKTGCHAHFLDALPIYHHTKCLHVVIRGNQFYLYVSSRPQNHQKIEAEGVRTMNTRLWVKRIFHWAGSPHVLGQRNRIFSTNGCCFYGK